MVDRVLDKWPDATMVEVGPKRVLSSMLGRKWHKGVSKLHTDDEEDPRAQIDSVVAALSGDASRSAGSSGGTS